MSVWITQASYSLVSKIQSLADCPQSTQGQLHTSTRQGWKLPKKRAFKSVTSIPLFSQAPGNLGPWKLQAAKEPGAHNGPLCQSI